MLAQTQPPGPSGALWLVIILVDVLVLCGIVWGIRALFRYLRKIEPRGGANREVSQGVAGLLLVSLGLLRFAELRAGDIGDFFWFVAVIGIVASFVGLIVSIVALFKGSGQGAACAGIALGVVLSLLFLRV
jgi:hypothetical protein